MTRKTKEISKILRVEDTSNAPTRLMEILQNRTEREKVFKEMLELFDYKVDFDWFSEYFQETLADKKNQGQVFTPPHIANLIVMLDPIEQGFILEPCAGTGALTISQWDQVRNKADYRPSDFVFLCEELSGNAIPFLIFNLAVRGITGVVNHCNTMTRGSWGAFLILNERDSSESFSNIIRLPYGKTVERLLSVEFMAERYFHQFEFQT